jgi:hypothetical protein
MTEQASISVLVSPELVEQMTEGKWSAPVQVTIDRLNVPGPSGETHMMTARSYPQAVDDGPTARLARESIRQGLTG